MKIYICVEGYFFPKQISCKNGFANYFFEHIAISTWTNETGQMQDG